MAGVLTDLYLDEATRAIAKHVRGLHKLNLSICVSLRDSTVIAAIVRHNPGLRHLSLSGLKWCVTGDVYTYSVVLTL